MVWTILKKILKSGFRFRYCRPPGGSWTGKNWKFLFLKLEQNLFYKVCYFMDSINLFEDKFEIGLQVQVLQDSRWILDR